ncbi:thymidylate synthase [Variovorax dokdonensis]|uniref:Thymidylate synthase n=1 Tax=Variovorax dokdonensis TaxID=344883 RepID=A0ABT7NC54_9BURK|nr:thymidylate synthase [Variovorax dokdonensis]MDM0045541.1 thymidylate synthase [Variovorax dokdonensis]
MQQYLDLVRNVFDQGSWQDNRTGIRTLSIPGAMLRFDLQQGFPAVTTKKLAFKSAVGEMVGFLRASRSAAEFRALGCKVWDQNANENAQWLANPYRLQMDDLGPVYGVQWRQWPAYKLVDMSQAQAQRQVEDALARGYSRIGELAGEQGAAPQVLLYKAVDQLRQCLDTIIKNPSDRRILFHGWNWAQLEEMALPPCHLLYQFLVNASKREISLCLYVRSNDIGLGTPFNLTEGAALLHLVGRLTGYTPRWFTYFIGDAHIYENHVDMLQEQLKRTPLPAPQLQLSDRIPDYAVTGRYEPEWLEKVEPSDFSLVGYEHHPPLTAPMAV